MKKNTAYVGNWKEYQEIFHKQGTHEAWKYARHFLTGDDLEAARRYHCPNDADRRASRARQKAINAVTTEECRTHCQV